MGQLLGMRSEYSPWAMELVDFVISQSFEVPELAELS